MTYAVTGVSGNTGRIVAETLLAQGRQVRVVVRDDAKGKEWKLKGAEVAIASLTDAAALTLAFKGVEGAYVLIPTNFAAEDTRKEQQTIAKSVATAAKAASLPHIVLLSSVGAQNGSGGGPINGIHDVEKVLNAIGETKVTNLRAGYFYGNIVPTLGAVRDAGILPSFFPTDYALPMVSINDIGTLAASLLVEGTKTNRVVELGTPHSFGELARALSTLVKKPVRVEEAPIEAVVPAFTGLGLPQGIARLYEEMISGMKGGHVRFEGTHRHVEAREPLEKALGALLG